MVMYKKNQEQVEDEQPRRVAVKFVDEFSLPYEDGAEKYFEGEWMERWMKLSEKFPGITLRRVYTAVSSERMKELVAAAVLQDPTYEPPNFLAFFTISVPSLEMAKTLAELLQRWEIVEEAYVESLPDLPFQLPQNYVESPAMPSVVASPHIGGIGATYAWMLLGGDGRGVNFVDIERGWRLDHPDLRNSNGQPKISGPLGGFNYGIRTPPPPPSTNLFDYQATRHGTSVLGILASNRHPDGWQGIVPAATGSVVSPWRGSPAVPDCHPITGKLNAVAASYLQPGDWNVANAIIIAIDQLNFGDVILLELQSRTPQGVYYPIEYEPANYQSIRLATALGMVVVEAAGNGSQDINPVLPRDSGAIIVGAAIPTSFGGATAGARHGT